MAMTKEQKKAVVTIAMILVSIISAIILPFLVRLMFFFGLFSWQLTKPQFDWYIFVIVIAYFIWFASIIHINSDKVIKNITKLW